MGVKVCNYNGTRKQQTNTGDRQMTNAKDEARTEEWFAIKQAEIDAENNAMWSEFEAQEAAEEIRIKQVSAWEAKTQ